MAIRFWFVILALAGLLALAACGGSAAPATSPPAGNTLEPPAGGAGGSGSAENGKTLFTSGANRAVACSTCHSVQPGVTLVGPSLAGIAERGATRAPGQNAHDYIEESIVAPNAHIVEGFSNPSPMPGDYGKKYTDQQVEDLVAYLLTLR